MKYGLPARWLRPAVLLWLAVYLVVLIAVVAGMLQLRRTTLATMGTPAARAEWQAWRDAPPNVKTDLPVRRRRPSSEEPPALVLMRDYFGVMMTAAVVFGSLLFAVIALLAAGALQRDKPSASPQGRN
jgi:uncharacterized membrane protein YedE/YeeE